MMGLQLPEDSDAVRTVLAHGEIEVKGRLRWSSNATFLVAVHAPDENSTGKTKSHTGSAKAAPHDDAGGRGVLAIYKPTKGERPLWDFPRGLWKREVAAYELGSALGWDLVPPTAVRLDAPLGPGRCSTAWTQWWRSTISAFSRSPATMTPSVASPFLT